MSMISGGDATFVRSQSPDAAVAVVTTASFAVGITLISRVRRFTCNFEAAPFGTVTGADFRIIAGVCVGTFGLVLLFYKEFLYATFDPGRRHRHPCDHLSRSRTPSTCPTFRKSETQFLPPPVSRLRSRDA